MAFEYLCTKTHYSNDDKDVFIRYIYTRKKKFRAVHFQGTIKSEKSVQWMIMTTSG